LPLLIEIGCEEIPARFLAGAQKEFGERLQEGLREAALLAGADGEPLLQTYSTPRRLVAYVPDVLEKQHDRVEELRGPAVKAAFDAQGKPTRAAESFAAKNGAAVRNLIKVSTPKGEYVALQKRIPGRPALEVLPEILPPVITGLSFPKSMYWEQTEGAKFRFVRPIRWLLALFGSATVSFAIPRDVESLNETRGHRVLGSERIWVTSFKDYAEKLRQELVEVDPEKRRERVRTQTQALLEGTALKVVEDRELEEWVVNSTEWPSVVLGTFKERFLKLPREILITVMRDHQKYFAVEDTTGNLQPHFVASLNLDGDEKGLIRAGHERVLAARFADAEFFWNADQKVPLRDRLPMLERVTYQAKLGSYADKVRRMEHVARRLCADLEGQGRLSAQQSQTALRAVRLCKCDLTSQMVQEFTELQGVVGGLYAAAQGEPEEVADGIYDHYKPLGLDDQLPRSTVGAMVSLADKIDAVVGGFAAGLEPTASADPFALRRHGNAAVKLLLEALPPLNLAVLLSDASELLKRPAGALMPMFSFFVERVRYYLATRFRYDTVRAVLAAYGQDALRVLNDPADGLRRAAALEKFRDTDDFIALSQAAKRVRNILTKSASEGELQSGTLNVELLEAGAETELHQAYLQAYQSLIASDSLWGDYERILAFLATLRPRVDNFFNKVLVMADDPNVRKNRILLLALLDQEVFSRFVDLSEIVTHPSGPEESAPSGAR
jgi:glycyl-tRNA synthetase beta chain